MRRKNNFLAVCVVFIVLVAFMLIEVQSTVGANSSSSGSGYTMQINYKITGSGSPSAPTITYVTPQGKQESQTIPLYPDIISITMGKSKLWSVTPNPLNPSTGDERWISTSTLSGTSPNGGSTTKTFSFQHQYKLTIVSAYDTPKGTGWYNSGTTVYAQLSKTAAQDGSGTRHIFTSWSGDASGTNQKSNAITMTSPRTVTANWKTQYQITFNVDPYNSGTTLPSGTNWYDSGKTINILASKKDSNTFATWTKTGSTTIADPSKASTTATINGPDTITANFAKPKDSQLTVSVYPKTVDKSGSQVTTITGRLTSNHHGVANEPVVLMYNCGTGDKPITTIITSSAGSFSYDWNPADSLSNGIYVIKASFAGDSNYKASCAATSCRGDLTVVPEYSYGAFAALVACFAGLVVFKKRNNPHILSNNNKLRG